MTTISLTPETHNELQEIKRYLILQSGDTEITYNDVVAFCAKEAKMNHKVKTK